MSPVEGGEPLRFWFELASTYSYVAALRVEDVARSRGVPLEWSPFLLGPLFRRQGWSDSPFNLNPARGRYMWRDVERLCAKHGLPFRKPSEFPRNSLLAARVACVAIGEPWLPEFARAVYRANFAEDRDIADADLLGGILGTLGQDATEILARAQSQENKDLLRRRTDEAWDLGIFGAPTFEVRGEIFWGNDRLEDAFAWYEEARR